MMRGKRPRAMCPECGIEICLRKDGTFQFHRDAGLFPCWTIGRSEEDARRQEESSLAAFMAWLEHDPFFRGRLDLARSEYVDTVDGIADDLMNDLVDDFMRDVALDSVAAICRLPLMVVMATEALGVLAARLDRATMPVPPLL